MSGFTEIYIHIPTTNTYYINHVPSTPMYGIGESDQLTAINVSKFGRDKQVFSHDPNNSYTRLSLSLDKSAFSIDALVDVQACGNSLPLGIYKETVQNNGSDTDYQAAQYFNSYIAPTVLVEQKQDESRYGFDFACFGTDEQSIRLQFMDSLNKYGADYCTLVFRPGYTMDQNLVVKQKIRADGGKYKLARNRYVWPGDEKIFMGWTFTQSPGDNPDTSTLNGFYLDTQEITFGEISEHMSGPIGSGREISIYAVWMTYQFSETDMTLTVNPPSGKNRFGVGGYQPIPDEQGRTRVVVSFEQQNQ